MTDRPVAERDPNTEARERLKRMLNKPVFETFVTFHARSFQSEIRQVLAALEQAGRALEQERGKFSALVEDARRVDAQVREGEEEHARNLAADPSYKPPYAGTIDSTIYLLNLKASAYRIVRALASSPGEPNSDPWGLGREAADPSRVEAAETETSG